MEEPTNNTNPSEHHHSQKKSEISLPTAIIVAAFIIGIALIVIKTPSSTFKNVTTDNTKQNNTLEPATIREMVKMVLDTKNQDKNNFVPVSSKDHVVGSTNPKITIVEYSDLECPFCKVFHSTMNKVMRTYSDNVAWVYRNFPLDCVDSKDPQCTPLHSKARDEALAAECTFEQGGNDVFFTYINMIFQQTPSNNRLDPQILLDSAKGIGLDMKKFTSCVTSKKYASLISDEVKGGIKIGVNGTPTSIMIDSQGNTYQIQGALPYEVVAGTIDSLIGTK